MVKSKTGSRIPYYMMIAVVAGFGIILIMNAATMLGIVPSRYLSPNDVRGMAVEHAGKLYTLNFAQQNELTAIFNRTIPVGRELLDARKAIPPHPPEVERIIVYRFHAPDLVITPAGYVLKTTSATGHEADKYSLVFSIPEWNANGLLEESTSDELVRFLSATYGP